MGNRNTRSADPELQDVDNEEEQDFQIAGRGVDEPENKKPEDFSRRVCVKYVAGKDNKDGLCSGCKQGEREGFHRETVDLEEWNWRTCTEKIQTNAYGELKFPSSYSKKAKYIVIENETSIDDMMNFLYSDIGFGLSPPKMILSVTGGAQQFSIDEDTKTAFKLGLMKAAKTTNAWIISGGTNKGVMRLVGDAYAEDLHAQDLTVLGIASWGCIAFNEDMIIAPSTENPEDERSTHKLVPYYPQNKTSNTKLVALNPNHSNFILVDNGSAYRFGVEIDFRTNLETRIRETLKIPMVLIVVEGGVGTLNTILGALKSKTPIILVANTKGCADFVREAKDRTRRRHQGEWPRLIDHLWAQYRLKKTDETIDIVNEIIGDPEYDSYVNVFQMNTEGCGKDIEQSILNALSKAKTNTAQRIEIAIRWNRFDIAKEEMRLEKNTNVEEDKLTADDLNNLLEIALLENKYQFVNLILEHEIDLENFLTITRLQKLFNYEASQDKTKYEEPFLMYLQKKYDRIKINIEMKNIRKLNRDLFPGSNFFFLPKDFSVDNELKDPEMNLFYWCILSNRIEIAKIFWRLGKYQISNALIASKILNFFAGHLPDFATTLENSAKEFEDLAIGVLRVYDKNTRECVNDVLVIRYLRHLEMDCLQLAVHCKCKKFVSYSTVQSILDNIWRGKSNDNTKLSEREVALKKCQKYYNKDRRYVFNSNRVSGFAHNATRWEKFKSLFYVPYWHFILNLIFYIFFLLLFSYTLLFDYKYEYHEEKVPLETNEASNESNGTSINGTKDGRQFEIKISGLSISGYEVILLLWIIALIAEEIRQFLSASRASTDTWIDNVKKYFKEQWNILDVLGCGLFILGFILKILSLINNKDSAKFFHAARAILSIDVAIWYMRALHFCLVLESLGPKLLMIRKMFDDLKYFLIIIATFVLAFGVSLQSIIVTDDSLSPHIFLEILNVAYWPIFGEISILGTINNDSCADSTEPPCLDSVTYVTSYILLMVYMVIANVLLINLLIAMFSSTYERIQEGSDVVWKNQRYNLICEYVDSPILPPPFNLIVYIWYGVEKFRGIIAPVDKGQQIEEFESDILIDYEQKSAQELLNEKRSASEDENSSHNKELQEKLENLEARLSDWLAQQQPYRSLPLN